MADAYSIYDTIKSWFTNNGGVSTGNLPGTMQDTSALITDESGGNPFAINDITTGQSYQFTSYQDAWTYMQVHPKDKMAVGLFQLLLNGGLGDQLADQPQLLLDPGYQISIAGPYIVKNEAKASSLPSGSQSRFAAVAGNPWYADTLQAGGPGVPSQSSISQTVSKLQGVNDNAIADSAAAQSPAGQAVQGVSNAVSTVGDFLKNLWSLNGLLIVGGSIVIVSILINMAKGGGRS